MAASQGRLCAKEWKGMSKYANFELQEFLRSDTAKAKGIDNTPSFEVVAHLEELISTILQPLRTAWGKSLIISSGYRCEALNKAVGGVKNSAHLYGYAADVQTPRSKDFKPFMEFAEKWLKDNGIAFDQSIKETSKTAYWWHIGLYNSKGEQRRQFKALQV